MNMDVELKVVQDSVSASKNRKCDELQVLLSLKLSLLSETRRKRRIGADYS